MTTFIISTQYNAYTPKALRLVNILYKLKQSEVDVISDFKFKITKQKNKNIFVLRSHHGHSQYANEHLGIKLWKGTFLIPRKTQNLIKEIVKTSHPGCTFNYNTCFETYKNESFLYWWVRNLNKY